MRIKLLMNAMTQVFNPSTRKAFIIQISFVSVLFLSLPICGIGCSAYIIQHRYALSLSNMLYKSLICLLAAYVLITANGLWLVIIMLYAQCKKTTLLPVGPHRNETINKALSIFVGTYCFAIWILV